MPALSPAIRRPPCLRPLATLALALALLGLELSPTQAADPAPPSGIWISDSENGRIVYLADLKGEGFKTLGYSGRGPGRFLRPEQVWVDREGRVHVADRGNGRIVRFDDMQGTGYSEMTGFEEPVGVAVHGERLFVSDRRAGRVLVYPRWGAEPEAVLEDRLLQDPGQLWVDLEGNLYAACGEDPPGGRVVRIPADRSVPSSAWEVYRGRGLSGAHFDPRHALVTPRGLFIADGTPDRIVRVDDPAGRDPREIGGYGTRPGRFIQPAGLATDERGRIYVADFGSDRLIRMDDISGSGWQEYRSPEVTRLLRGPRSVFVWAPSPPRPSPSPSPSRSDDEG